MMNIETLLIDLIKTWIGIFFIFIYIICTFKYRLLYYKIKEIQIFRKQLDELCNYIDTLFNCINKVESKIKNNIFKSDNNQNDADTDTDTEPQIYSEIETLSDIDINLIIQEINSYGVDNDFSMTYSETQNDYNNLLILISQ